MEQLFDIYYKRLRNTPTEFVRSVMGRVSWESRLVGLRGARGTGKTTLLLQRLKSIGAKAGEALYVSLDNIYFSDKHVYELARDFVNRGGRYLMLDEVHKYPNWSQELKNIYDDFPELKVAFAGSSLLSLKDGNADLSRRALMFDMQGLSFREYLNMRTGVRLPVFSIEDITGRTVEVANAVLEEVRPLQYLGDYLREGYYPFFVEGTDFYHQRLNEVVSYIIDAEMPQLRGVDTAMLPKVKQLLMVISESAPFVPNVTKIAERIGLSRVSLLVYMKVLAEARLTMNMMKAGDGLASLQKPSKIYLENSNLMYALTGRMTDIGNVRETFFANQMREGHDVRVSPVSDFLVDGRYTFEIGGRKKGRGQIAGVEDAYVVADDVEYGGEGRLPLWMAGMLY